jgi:transposase IS200 family protein
VTSFSPAFNQPLPRIEAGSGIVSERQRRKAARTLGVPSATAFDQLGGNPAAAVHLCEQVYSNSTKNRESWLESDASPRVHAYLATICRDLGAELAHVGGVADHVHIVTTRCEPFPKLN